MAASAYACQMFRRHDEAIELSRVTRARRMS